MDEQASKQAMSETQHMPGPWWEREPVSYASDVERLKKSASELLAALRDALSTLRLAYGRGHAETAERLRCIERTGAVIAKAEGRK